MAEKKGLKRMYAQAVGGAVGHNPIGIIIPCHRVVGSGGNLTGFGGGIQAKTELLRLEGADMKSFYVPKKGTAL
ncbi:methylated-DNA--protein-cysteine methyltransferase [Clostridium sp. CAG:149]|nr:methylated-DNA--protein-cysteine methyltransferase [Clostridium sp. CAG:149]